MYILNFAASGLPQVFPFGLITNRLRSPQQLAMQPTGIPAEEWIAIRFAYLFVPDGPLRMKWSLQAVVQREGRSCCRFFNEHSFARAPAWSRSGRSGVDSLTSRSLVQSFD